MYLNRINQVGDDFTVRRTNNSGTSWQSVAPSTLASVTSNFDLHLVHCVSYNDAYIFGDAGAARVNAQGVATSVPSFATDIRAIDAQNSKLIALSGNNTINRYTLSTSGISYVSTITGSGTYNAIAYQSTDNLMAVGMSGVFAYFAAGNTPITVTTPVPMQITGDMRTIDVKGTNIVVAGDNGKYFRMTSSGMNASGEHQNIEWIEMDGIYLSGSDLYRDPTTWESYITAANQINIRSVAIASATQVVFGGNYNSAFFSTTGLTNATVQYPYVRTAFDPGDRYSSLFYYDKLGRLVLSQNARQRNSDDRKFSYTIYDELGRVVEVGEKSENETLADGTLGVFYFRDIFGSMVSGHYNPKVIDNDKLNAWVGGDGARNEVTRSYYDVFRDDFYDPISITINQDNQRKRIAHVAYYSTWVGDTLNYDHATHFVYDIHGNVTKMMQDNRKMATEFETLADHRVKTMEYSYDLISGNVHRMSVQSGESDQWHHAYSYDADNRVIAVHTSTQTPLISIDQPAQFLANELTQNAVNWDLEAKYFYYAHGNLARVELGNQLQGLDYIYNLQGWLKGVNATSLNNNHDPGEDGTGLFSKDVMAYSLHYYENDYTPISGAANRPAMYIDPSSFAATNTSPTAAGINLYNGNIRFMQTTLTDIERDQNGVPMSVPLPMLNAYKYDQLNRLVEARSYTDGLANNEWNPTALSDKYHNTFTYDANGNILTQERRNSNGDMLDDLTYRYQLDGMGNIVSNRLYHANDAAGLQNQGDLAQQYVLNANGTMSSSTNYNNADANINVVNNYKYDGEGRLVRDLSERIQLIEWRVDGKVRRITFQNDANTPPAQIKNTLEFDYDAFGRRIAKHEFTPDGILVKSTYYLLDVSGNLMNTYIHKPDEPAPFELTERVIYGSSRLGMNTKKADMLFPVSENVLSSYTGEKLYEMRNHLGNVLTVINDIKIPYESDGEIFYYATITNTADYSPFGVTLDEDGGRTQYLSVGKRYRYQFNGMEVDDEPKGEGNNYTTEFRQYDPRLGRWLSLDPLMAQFPNTSPYVAFANNPIFYVDPNGLAPQYYDPKLNAYVKGEVVIRAKYSWTYQVMRFYDKPKVPKKGTSIFARKYTAPQIDIPNYGKMLLDEMKSWQKSGSDYTSRTSESFNSWTQPARDWRDQFNNDAHAAFDAFFSLPSLAEGGGGFFEFNMGGAVGGGISLSIGVVADSHGDWKFYGSFTGNAGLGASLGFKSGAIAPTHDGGDFRVENFSGTGDGWSALIQVAGFGPSGGHMVNTNGGGFMDQSNVPKEQAYYTLEWDSPSGKSASFVKYLGKSRIQVSGMISSSRTWVFGGN